MGPSSGLTLRSTLTRRCAATSPSLGRGDGLCLHAKQVPETGSESRRDSPTWLVMLKPKRIKIGVFQPEAKSNRFAR